MFKNNVTKCTQLEIFIRSSSTFSLKKGSKNYILRYNYSWHKCSVIYTTYTKGYTLDECSINIGMAKRYVYKIIFMDPKYSYDIKMYGRTESEKSVHGHRILYVQKVLGWKPTSKKHAMTIT